MNVDKLHKVNAYIDQTFHIIDCHKKRHVIRDFIVNDNNPASTERRDEAIKLLIALCFYMSPMYFMGLMVEHSHLVYVSIMVFAATWSILGIFVSYYAASKLAEYFLNRCMSE